MARLTTCMAWRTGLCPGKELVQTPHRAWPHVAELLEAEPLIGLELLHRRLGLGAEILVRSGRSEVEAKIEERLLHRAVNVDLSGGERKRNETMQLAVLRPRIAILDELDSGLDIDALRACARRIEAALILFERNGDVASARLARAAIAASTPA